MGGITGNEIKHTTSQEKLLATISYIFLPLNVVFLNGSYSRTLYWASVPVVQLSGEVEICVVLRWTFGNSFFLITGRRQPFHYWFSERKPSHLHFSLYSLILKDLFFPLITNQYVWCLNWKRPRASWLRPAANILGLHWVFCFLLANVFPPLSQRIMWLN